MKKLATIFLSATLLSSNVLADRVVATFNGGEVKESEVMNQFKQALELQPESKGKKFSELEKNVQELLVKSYLNGKLLEQEATRLKIRDSEEFKSKLKNIESQIIQQELIERQLKDKITDKMVEEEYKKYSESLKGQEEVKTSHILVENEETAKEIKKKLNKGTNFSELVTQYSKDEGSKSQSGELGYVTKGQLVPEYEAKAFSMKKNEVSDPVKTQFGWHIIKLLDRRPVEVPTKEQAEQQIRNKISREIVEKYFKELSEKAKIELKLDSK